MSSFSRCLPLLTALAVSVPAAAAEFGLAREDGVRLLQACEAAQSLIEGHALADGRREDARLCIGFLEGFAWGHGWEAWRRGADMYFCPPEGFGYRDAVPAVTAYLQSHPERQVQRAHLLVFSALSSAFPCTP
jgi:hypothetical protein